MSLESFMEEVTHRNQGEYEFLQAVEEVAESVLGFIARNPRYQRAKILERMTEPDRIIIFRVCWEDDEGEIHINRGYRVQMNNSIGPYKGGLRFHPLVTLSVLKFLAFEQTFKNSLTGLPMGGGKGGSDFDPKGRSDSEVMRFCQSFMNELHRHIGKNTDIPAGDIGVGAREISFLFGQYKRLRNEFTGTITGKSLSYGGSFIRMEATGYGCVYFTQNMLERRKDSLEGKTCVISGSGNVAQYTAEKLLELGAKVVTLSDSNGFIHDPEGIDKEKLEWIIDLKTNRRGRIKAYVDEFGGTYHEGEKPWGIPCDAAFPSATENEISDEEARTLLKNGCQAVAEGANMPTTHGGAQLFQDAKILYAPSKAANAGGVAISGVEMTQNSMRLSFSREQVDDRLREIMKNIHETCVEYGAQSDGYVNYVDGANIGGFVKVADAMLAYGVV